MKETIAAIATGMSNSGIGIVRISGEEAIDIIDKIFVPKKTNKKWPMLKVIQFITEELFLMIIL